MPFRANESALQNNQRAYNYLIRSLPPEMRENSRSQLERLVDELGPVVDSYPTWHPLVLMQDPRSPITKPNERCGYKRLDHTVFLRNGFISCPYGGVDDLIESIRNLPSPHVATIDHEVLEYKLYRESATAIVVRCNWNIPMNDDGTIPLPKAVGLLLETEIPCWRWSQYGETWENMREYFLGAPCGKQSSLFVNEKTGMAMRKVWNTIINTGIFGPLMVGR